MWTTWGIDASVTPYTDHFPRADIHELITPDLLHQLIKGTFKDHLVTWVEQYLHTVHSKANAQRIMDDIDHQIAAVPAFPGLCRFPEGRNFKQWTGNNLKALMKVCLTEMKCTDPGPKLTMHPSSDMVRCFAASTHDTPTLTAMQAALDCFHQYRTIFETARIRTDGFSLPRQHALEHYIENIRLFGSPNGICSSITELKHICAVKEPWRCSSKNNPLLQIFTINQRLGKLAAARAYYTSHHDGMLIGSVLADALGIQPIEDEDDAFSVQSGRDEEDEVADIEGDPGEATSDVHGRILVYRSATVTFYTPSELSGDSGMHHEIIRCNPSWRNEYERFDTILVDMDPTCPGMLGMAVVRVVALIAFTHDNMCYPCALVEWFKPVGEGPDSVTGMYVVRPEVEDGQRVTTLIHLDLYHETRIPVDFHFSYLLDVFDMFYVNQYADYHSHECIF
ncbi:hypothetical protein B0H21DRAFT_778807 [Amylocystis lapponica]|nr:hypothetical protein B0H21DRAFT_778807 [Amylocystis lapponica]